MIPAIELAEAEAELHAEYLGAPATTRWVVTVHGLAVKFHQNLCGYWATPVTHENATRFDDLHAASAAVRQARVTGLIRFETVNK